ncbi:MAG: DUF739 family protein [Oscillospiraceae bacterium]|nr:DUF739 family protein [Oscillospiraceae bacterium]
MNISELKAEIARKNVTYRKLAEQLQISEQAFYNKLNGHSEFKSSEIKTVAHALRLSVKDVNKIFFGL